MFPNNNASQSNFSGYPQVPPGSSVTNQQGYHPGNVQPYSFSEGQGGGIPSSPWIGNASGGNGNPPLSGYDNPYPSANASNSMNSPFQSFGGPPQQMGPQAQMGPRAQMFPHAPMGAYSQNGLQSQMGPQGPMGPYSPNVPHSQMGLPSYGLSPPGVNPSGMGGMPNPIGMLPPPIENSVVGYLPIHKKNKPPGMSDKEWKKEMKEQKKAAKMGMPVGHVSAGGIPVGKPSLKKKH